MKKLLTLLAFAPCALFAQTTWQVEAGGSTSPGSTPPYYSPMELVIDVGDLVHWTGVSGTHNVYGMQDMFPTNPEGFSSGNPTSNLNYLHAFTVPGVYGYHCTQTGHSITQHGTITVLDPQQVGERTPAAFRLYPSPAQETITVERAQPGVATAEIRSLSGQLLGSVALGASGTDAVPVDHLAPGTYVLVVREADGTRSQRPFVKQ